MMVEETGVRDLIERARNGDVRALGRLLEAHRPTLERLARRELCERLAGRVDPSDLVQQTYLEAHRAFAQFRGMSAAELGAWLRRALVNNLAEAIRNAEARKRVIDRKPSLGEGALDPDRLESSGSTPSEKAMRAERATRLVGALSDLPPDQREAVRLRHLEGRSLVEIAQAMGRTQAATAGLIKRGLEGLRARLRDDDRDTSHG